MNQSIERAGVGAACDKAGNDTEGIVEPGSFLRWFERMAEVNFNRRSACGRAELDPVYFVVGRSGSDDRVAFNRHGKNEPIVIIGMFSDDVHPAGGGGNPARLAIVCFGELIRDGFAEVC